MKKYASFYLGLALLLFACSKNDDGLNPGGPNPSSTDLAVQDFMWKAMNLWYFWQDDVDDLADDRFSTDEEYTAFLEQEEDPETFFFDYLTYSEDRFSFLSDDYVELTQNLSGLSRSNGVEFGLTYFDDNDNNMLDDNEEIFGYVRYIIPNSDASGKDIARGDVFTGVDGQTLTGGNYVSLLFGDNATYTLNMADVINNEVTPNGEEVSLTKEEELEENPVYIVKSFDISGHKIGYFMYNGFTNEFDQDMNDAIGQLKSEGVTDLVLDLRYNPGGSVNSSRLLSSMIYGTNTSEVYLKQRWNSKIQSVFDDSDVTDYFANKLSDGTTLNTLNLNKVYVLTTHGTASASELVINCLDPYIEVVTIGTSTTGKNEFSLTMVDDPDRDGAPFIYTPSRENQINPDNHWAIQPLVGRNENAVGFSDYTAGIPADIELEEDLANLGILGDMNEPLLARAIEEITGISSKKSFEVAMPVKLLTSSKMFKPLRDNMYLDKPLHLPIQ